MMKRRRAMLKSHHHLEISQSNDSGFKVLVKVCQIFITGYEIICIYGFR